MNFFNPYILVMCQHNHDIKCILSGKAAKAAKFYITDVLTKSFPRDQHTFLVTKLDIVGDSIAGEYWKDD